MEPFALWFVMFSPLWWVLILGAFVTIVWALEADSWKISLAAVAIPALTMMFLGDFNPFPWLFANPWTFVYYCVGYVITGGVIAWLKWMHYCKMRINRYEADKVEWLRDHGVTITKSSMNVPEEHKDAWSAWLLNSSAWSVSGHYDKPRRITVQIYAFENKERIVRWATFWWAVIVWFVCFEFLNGIFRSLYHWMGDILEATSNWMFSGVKNDFNQPKK